MKVLRKFWKDPVGSKIISFIIISFLILIWGLLNSLFSDLSFKQIFENLSSLQVKIWIPLLLIAILLIVRGILIKSRIVSSKSVKFWHKISDRQDIGIDVRGMIKKANHKIFISGISLDYVITKCSEELKEAINRDVSIDIVLIDPSIVSDKAYSIYLNIHDKGKVARAIDKYIAFYQDLAQGDKGKFNFYVSPYLLTHSIGKYDDVIIISELCINNDSVLSPSYEILKGMPSFNLFDQEINILISESKSLKT